VNDRPAAAEARSTATRVYLYKARGPPPGLGIRRPGPRQHVCEETLDGPDLPDVTRRHAVGTGCRSLDSGGGGCDCESLPRQCPM
jgi:hypothetical protein